MAEAAEQDTYEQTLARGAAEQKAILTEQIGEQKGQSAQDVAELQRLQREQKPEYERFKQKQMEMEGMRPPPVLEKPPPAPRTQEMIAPSSLEKTVGMASIFALLSVGMAKGSAIYGLKALGGFLTGAHAGNLEQADAAIKDFNSEMKRVHDANEYSRQQYLDVFNNKKYTLEMQEHAIHLKALEMKDELMVQARREKGMTGVHDLIRQRADVDHKMGQEMHRYRQWEETIRHHKAMEAKGPGGAGTTDSVLGIPMSDIPAAPPGQTNEAFLAMLKPAQQAILQKIVKGDIATSGFGNLAVKERNEYIKAASIYKPDFTTRTYGLLDKALKEATPGGPIGRNELAINTVAHHIDQFADAFKQLNNSQVQRWNNTRNAIRSEFGDPKLNALKVPAGLASAEIARIVKGGTAAPTEDEIKYWESVFNTSSSPQQAMGVIWQSLQGIGGRLVEIERAYHKLGMTDYKVLNPETRELLLKHKPKNVKTPDWLAAAPKRSPSDLSDLEKQAELSPARAAEITAQKRAEVRRALPRAKNPKTGEVMIFEGGQWKPE